MNAPVVTSTTENDRGESVPRDENEKRNEPERRDDLV